MRVFEIVIRWAISEYTVCAALEIHLYFCLCYLYVAMMYGSASCGMSNSGAILFRSVHTFKSMWDLRSHVSSSLQGWKSGPKSRSKAMKRR